MFLLENFFPWSWSTIVLLKDTVNQTPSYSVLFDLRYPETTDAVLQDFLQKHRSEREVQFIQSLIQGGLSSNKHNVSAQRFLLSSLVMVLCH